MEEEAASLSSSCLGPLAWQRSGLKVMPQSILDTPRLSQFPPAENSWEKQFLRPDQVDCDPFPLSLYLTCLVGQQSRERLPSALSSDPIWKEAEKGQYKLSGELGPDWSLGPGSPESCSFGTFVPGCGVPPCGSIRS